MKTENDRLKLTLGPIFFQWSLDRIWKFYSDVAQKTEFDRVHVGDVICGRRMQYQKALLPEIVGMLEAAGKEVVLSDLVAAALHVPSQKSGCLPFGTRMVEINSVARLRRRTGRAVVIGPFLDIHNEEAAGLLVRRGAQTICLPATTPRASIKAIAVANQLVDIEVFAFGRVPRAFSTVCHHAALYERGDRSCHLACGHDPDGLAVKVGDGHEPFAISGCQTLSYGTRTYCPSVAELRAFGISRLRISPHTTDIVEIFRIYRRLLDEHLTPPDAVRGLSKLSPPGMTCGNHLLGSPGAAKHFL